MALGIQASPENISIYEIFEGSSWMWDMRSAFSKSSAWGVQKPKSQDGWFSAGLGLFRAGFAFFPAFSFFEVPVLPFLSAGFLLVNAGFAHKQQTRERKILRISGDPLQALPWNMVKPTLSPCTEGCARFGHGFLNRTALILVQKLLISPVPKVHSKHTPSKIPKSTLTLKKIERAQPWFASVQSVLQIDMPTKFWKKSE